LEEHGSEVENMLLTEWNMADAIAVAREEEREERDLQIAKNMLAKGYSNAEIIEITNLSPKQIKDLRLA